MVRRARLFSAVLVALVLAGCGGNKGPRTETNTFYYNEFEDLNTLDPARINARAPWWVGGQIYLGLVTLDSGMSPLPRIAKSWSVSPDGRTWRFNLRNDVKFADDPAFANGKGRVVTAEDVRYSFERICTPATASTGFWVFRGRVRGADKFFEAHEKKLDNAPEHVEGIRVVNDTTLEIELIEPYAPMIALMSIPYCYVVPHEAVEKYGAEFVRHPVGAGAFKLVEWRPGERITLARNNNYFEFDDKGVRLPYLDSVSISFLKDKQSEFVEFEQGRLDAISAIEPQLLDRVFIPGSEELVERFEGYGLHQVPSMSIEYYGFMLDTATPGGKASPFARSRALRQALNYAIDRERLVKFVLRGQAVPAVHGPIPPGTPGYTGVTGYTYDRQRALDLLKEAGYPGGAGLPQITLQVSEGAKNMAVAQRVQEEFKSIGVKLNLVAVAPPQHREMVYSGKLPFWRANWMADYPDGENFLVLFYSPYSTPTGSNTTHFSNVRVDSLYRGILDPQLGTAERSALFAEAERIIIDEAPWIFLYHSRVQRLTQPGIKGYSVDPLDRLLLTYVHKQHS